MPLPAGVVKEFVSTDSTGCDIFDRSGFLQRRRMPSRSSSLRRSNLAIKPEDIAQQAGIDAKENG